MHTSIEEAITDLEHGPAPVRDVLTGHTLTELPAGVKSGTLYPEDPNDPVDPESAIKTLKDQLQEVMRLARQFDFRYNMERSDLRPLPGSVNRLEERREQEELRKQEEQEEEEEEK